MIRLTTFSVRIIFLSVRISNWALRREFFSNRNFADGICSEISTSPPGEITGDKPSLRKMDHQVKCRLEAGHIFYEEFQVFPGYI